MKKKKNKNIQFLYYHNHKKSKHFLSTSKNSIQIFFEGKKCVRSINPVPIYILYTFYPPLFKHKNVKQVFPILSTLLSP